MAEQVAILEHAQLSLNFTCFASRWVPASPRLVVLGQHARGTGALEVYKLTNASLVNVAKLEKPSGFKCGTFGASSLEERHLATGAFDGTLDVWDLERPESAVYSAKRHGQIINAIDGAGGLGQSGAPEIATASRDGSVKVWDVRQKDEPVADMNPDSDVARDCWAVAFGNSYDEERCVVAGYDNGDVKLFDLRAMKLRWEANLPNGICGLQFDRKDIQMNKLLVTGLESSVSVFDMRTQHPEKGFASVTEKAHKSTVWVGAHLPQDRDVFATCGGNGGISLWKYKYPAQRVVKDDAGVASGVAGTLAFIASTGMTSQPINSFDWHPDKKGLFVATAFDQTVRVGIATNLNLV